MYTNMSIVIRVAPIKNVLSGHARALKESAQSDQGLHFPLIESLDIIEYFNGDQMPG